MNDDIQALKHQYVPPANNPSPQFIIKKPSTGENKVQPSQRVKQKSI